MRRDIVTSEFSCFTNFKNDLQLIENIAQKNGFHYHNPVLMLNLIE